MIEYPEWVVSDSGARHGLVEDDRFVEGQFLEVLRVGASDLRRISDGLGPEVIARGRQGPGGVVVPPAKKCVGQSHLGESFITAEWRV